MGQPLFLAENFFNVQQFRSHVVSSSSGAAALGQELFRVGVARRSVLNVFRLEDPTQTIEVRVDCDRVREADILIFDRNSDLQGRDITLDVSSDDFVTSYRAFLFNSDGEVVLGSSINDFTDPVGANSITTNEGATIVPFPKASGLQWAINMRVNADTDSGRYGGVYLGKSFTPTHGGRLPFDDEEMWLDFGVVRRGVPDNDVRHGRTGAFGIMMSGEAEWNEARRQFRELFGKGHPMWIAPDSDKAERTWFGYNAPGSMGAAFSERPQGRTVVVRADEYDPRLP